MTININFYIFVDVEKKVNLTRTKKNQAQPIIVPPNFGKQSIMHVYKGKKIYHACL